MFGSFGIPEILLIILVIVLFFGAKRIPELARGIGQGINEFKKTSNNIETDSTDKENTDTTQEIHNKA